MVNPGEFEVWFVTRELPPLPPDGYNSGGFEVWDVTDEQPPVLALSAGGGAVGQPTDVLVSPYRAVRAGQRFGG